MPQKIENCTAILSDDGESMTLNVESESGVYAIYFPIGGNHIAVETYFDRHGEGR